MKTATLLAALACAASACTSLSPAGARVKVYEADLAAPPEARRLPQGCRFLAATMPVDQMESERHTEDPYRVQRNATGEQGGNVLLVLSSRFLTRSKTDCSPSDTSADCQNRAQNWYKVGFESYVCDGAALEKLAKVEPSATGIASWWPFGSKPPAPAAPARQTSSIPASAAAAAPPVSRPAAGISASDLKAKILVLMREGVGTDVIVAFARSNRLSAVLTADEILEWKKSGIAEPVIEAAISSAATPR